jgi:hypothetical protein
MAIIALAEQRAPFPRQRLTDEAAAMLHLWHGVMVPPCAQWRCWWEREMYGTWQSG